jgi:hypothetical protein
MHGHERRVSLHEVLQARVVGRMNLLLAERRIPRGRLARAIIGNLADILLRTRLSYHLRVGANIAPG